METDKRHQLKGRGFPRRTLSQNNKEAFYIIKGEIEIQLTKDGREETVTVKEGDFFVLKPYAVHSFKFKQDTLMVALYDKGVEEAGGQKDIYAA